MKICAVEILRPLTSVLLSLTVSLSSEHLCVEVLIRIEQEVV